MNIEHVSNAATRNNNNKKGPRKYPSTDPNKIIKSFIKEIGQSERKFLC